MTGFGNRGRKRLGREKIGLENMTSSHSGAVPMLGQQRASNAQREKPGPNLAARQSLVACSSPWDESDPAEQTGRQVRKSTGLCDEK